MTHAPLQIDFRPRPGGLAVVTSVPVHSIVESGRYLAFQDLIDGYAASFAHVTVVSPGGKPTAGVPQAERVSWLSGPRWLSPTNGLWWAAAANRHEIRNVDLVRSFGPRAGLVGRVLSRFSNTLHVSSADDLAGNTWRDKKGWRAALPKLVNGQGTLRADVLSATLDWELELLAESGYPGNLLLGARGLPTDIFTPVGTTDPDRHPVVLWAGNINTQDSISLVTRVACSTRRLIPDVEFIVVVEGDAADRLRSASAGEDLPLTVASYREVEPLVDLIKRTWACVTVPGRRKEIPHSLAMLALSAGVPLVSVGALGEGRGFQNHLNYVRVKKAESEEVAFSLQLLRRWSSFAHRIGLAGRRLVEERHSTRSVALVEGKQLARIADDLSVDVAMSDGARALQEFAAPRPFETASLADEEASGADGSGPAPGPEETAAPGLDLVAAAFAEPNGDSPPTGAAGEGVGGTSGPPAIPVPGDHADIALTAEEIEALFAEVGSSGDEGEQPVASSGAEGPTPGETDGAAALDQDAITASFGNGDEDDEAA